MTSKCQQSYVGLSSTCACLSIFDVSVIGLASPAVSLKPILPTLLYKPVLLYEPGVVSTHSGNHVSCHLGKWTLGRIQVRLGQACLVFPRSVRPDEEKVDRCGATYSAGWIKSPGRHDSIYAVVLCAGGMSFRLFGLETLQQGFQRKVTAVLCLR